MNESESELESDTGPEVESVAGSEIGAQPPPRPPAPAPGRRSPHQERRRRVRATLASSARLRDLVVLHEVLASPLGLRDPRDRSGL